jgi:hypothetical protein
MSHCTNLIVQTLFQIPIVKHKFVLVPLLLFFTTQKGTLSF